MKNIFLFYGEEKYDLNMRVEKIKKEFSRLEVGVNLFYLDKENIEELSSICQGVTFFGSEKLIMIKDTKLKFNVELITKDLDPDIKVILLEESVDKRTSEYKKIAKVAEVVEFKHMDAKQLSQYIMNTLKRYQVSITSMDAEYMQSICGEDKTNTINELQKLVIYLGEGGVATRHVIDKVCSKTLHAKIFDVLSMIVNKNKEQAMMKLDELLQQKEPVIKIAMMLYKQVKQMYMIKYLREKKISDIATILSLHPFVYKNLNQSCNRYSLEELKNIMYQFDTYDEKTKNGEMDFEIGLKKIIFSM